MAYSGRDFHSRLKIICKENGTSINAFMKSIGKSESAGTYMKSMPTADRAVVALAAQRFNVSEEWLMGATDVRQTSNLEVAYPLDTEEDRLINAIRKLPLSTRKVFLEISHATITTLNASEICVPSFSVLKKVYSLDTPPEQLPL